MRCINLPSRVLRTYRGAAAAGSPSTGRIVVDAPRPRASTAVTRIETSRAGSRTWKEKWRPRGFRVPRTRPSTRTTTRTARRPTRPEIAPNEAWRGPGARTTGGVGGGTAITRAFSCVRPRAALRPRRGSARTAPSATPRTRATGGAASARRGRARGRSGRRTRLPTPACREGGSSRATRTRRTGACLAAGRAREPSVPARRGSRPAAGRAAAGRAAPWLARARYAASGCSTSTAERSGACW